MTLTTAIKILNQHGHKCRRVAKNHPAYKKYRVWLNGNLREGSDIIRAADNLKEKR